MKVLVTGSEGQLGKSLQKIAPDFPKMSFEWTDIHNLDLTDESTLEKYFLKNKCDYIINCAAYTAVDKAEEEVELATRLNVEVPGHLAKIATRYNSILIHISTDFIFCDDQKEPIVETDTPHPKGVYATTKFKGEQEVLRNSVNAIIVRTSWLYSEYGKNFVKTILKYSNERDFLNVVNDQVGSPTYAADLAKGILIMLHQEFSPDTNQIFHFSNLGIISWFDFAIAIIRNSQIECKVNPITTEEFGAPSPRPKYSALNQQKFIDEFTITIPEWEESLKKCLSNLNQK